jgi:predicted exporter
MTGAARTLTVLFFTMIVGGVASFHLTTSYDLGVFLPQPQSSSQALLAQRLGEGPGAQLLFIELGASSPAQAMALAEELRRLPLVRRVLPETLDVGAASVPEALWRHRLLLGDLPSSKEAWMEVLLERMDDLMFAADDDVLALIAADPGLLSMTALSDFTAASGGALLFDQGATQYLVVESAVPGFSLEEQGDLVASIREALARHSQASIFGSPAYAVDLQDQVRSEASLFSTLASLALLALLIYRFRTWSQVIGVALPLAAGGASGLLALVLLFEEVHGITLAFGFTLLGVAIDYPLHLFAHAAGNGKRGQVWPTLRLGVFSTLLAYGAFFFSGTIGLRQLGVFAFTGIAVAALTAAWMTARAAHLTEAVADAHQQKLRWLPALGASALALGLIFSSPGFNDDLASLTPVDQELLAKDADVRRALGVADIRHLVTVRGASLQDVLIATEEALAALEPLLDDDQLSNVQSVVQILPSSTTQQRRRADLTLASLDVFRSALADLPLDPAAFAPFVEAWQQQRNARDFLTLGDLQKDPEVRTAVGSLLFETDTGWASLVFLYGLDDANAVRLRLENLAEAELIDLKATSEEMVSEYRNELLSLLLIALAIITVMLSLRVTLVRLAWLLLNMVAAVGIAAGASSLLQGGLSLFDLMALTLVAGLGLDYLLFYSRTRSPADDAATTSSVLICAQSSFIVFAILAISSIPVLRGIGTTVAVGVIAAYLLARWGRQANAGS